MAKPQGAGVRNDLVPTKTYDAGLNESVIGVPSIDDLKMWTEPAAQFIRSNAGIPEGPDVWVGKQPLSAGAFGLAGMWEKIDPEGNVVDQMVIKQIGPGKDGYWDSSMPQEVRIMEEMNKTGCPGVVELRNYRRYRQYKIHRIYMEYCPYGDVRKLYKRYRKFKQYLPEPFLWEVFYYLTEACAAMVNGPSGASWDNEIVHCDIKPGNIFLGLEDPQQNPFYPVAKLGDFGLAEQTSIDDPENPHELVGAGTPNYMAPEQRLRVHYPKFLRGSSKYLSSYTNIWAVGATMYELLTFHHVWPALFAEETDPEGGIEGLPKITTRKAPDYSHALRSLIRQCLRPNPQDRPRIAEMQLQIGGYRQKFADDLYKKRKGKKVAADEERLYYRGKEIETMKPGYWQPLRSGNLQGADDSSSGDGDEAKRRVLSPYARGEVKNKFGKAAMKY